MEGRSEDHSLSPSTSGRDEGAQSLPRGITHFHVRGPFTQFMGKNLRFLESLYWIKHPYVLYIPEATETVCTPRRAA